MITETDLTVALRQLHEANHSERQPGEFTIIEYAGAQTPQLTRNVAKGELDRLYRDGKLEKPPKRYIDGHLMVVYKMI